VLVLNAGAVPTMAPVQDQTWQTFSRSWESDTRHVFEWVGAAVRQPLLPGSVVVALSSGAALRGSPLSGGYAPAKAGVRFIASYAAGESALLGLGLRFVTLFPQLTPLAAVGAAGAAAYAGREGVGIEAYSRRFEPLLSPELVGRAVLQALEGDGDQELLLNGTGLHPLP
jgi:NAD(P)-dependent dehydrogenase (short-subunit alcohol dehydrogenase family)